MFSSNSFSLTLAGCAVLVAAIALISLLPSIPLVKCLLRPTPVASKDSDPVADELVLYSVRTIQETPVSCGKEPKCLGGASSSSSSSSCAHYLALASYLTDFLAKPHRDVGRKGPVCPFVPLALKSETLLVGMVRTHDRAVKIDDMVRLMRVQRDRFLRMAPTSGRLRMYKAIVVGFPDIADADAPRLIDEVQRRLKIEFTESGLMVGEFHRLNATPGLRNADFRPLRTPAPALAIRFMVPTDIAFLKQDAAYLRAFLTTVPDVAANANHRAEAEDALRALASV